MRSFFLRIIFPIVLLVVFGLISFSRVRFNVDAMDLLPAELPEVQAFGTLTKHFSRKNELVIILEAEDDPYLAEEAMRSLVAYLETHLKSEIASARGELPLLEDPKLGAEIIAWMWLNGEPERFEAMVAGLSSEKAKATLGDAMEEIQSGFFSERSVVLGYDPLGLTQFGSEGNSRDALSSKSSGFQSDTGEIRSIFVEAVASDFATYKIESAWVDAVRGGVESWKEAVGDEFDFEHLKIAFTGEPVFVSEIATSMEKDLAQSVLFTTLVICILFWLMHRRLKPLLWLVLMLAVVFLGTFAAGGIVLGEVSAMGIGFAAILIGLAVDYGVVLYRERGAGNGSAKTLRKQIGPSILWAAATTAVVFVSMNFSSLPGIRELGTLVALGIGIGAIVMLWMFTPMIAEVPSESQPDEEITPSDYSTKPAWIVTAIVAFACLVTILIAGWPTVNRESRPFHLKNSSAMAAVKKMRTEMKSGDRKFPVIVSAKSDAEVFEKLRLASLELQGEVEKGTLQQFTFPTALTPNFENQVVNLKLLKSGFLETEYQLLTAIEATGFTCAAGELTKSVFHEWTGFVQKSDRDKTVLLPENAASKWLFGRLISKRDGEIVVLGDVMPTDGKAFLSSPVKSESGSYQVAGWSLLIPALHGLIEKDFVEVFLPMGLILIVMLLVVFRDWRDVLLSLATLFFGGFVLVMLTLWFPMEWNFFNITGIPILFGTGLDYSIHMIFALRRSNGDPTRIREGIGKALLFCGCSTAVGFGSLSFAGTQGLSTLGVICGAGILLNMIIAVWLLPNWWRTVHRRKIAVSAGPVGL